MVELLLADWYPRKIVPEAGEVNAVPEVLRRWIRHAGRQRRLPAHLVEESVEAVDQWLPEFRSGMSERNRHGPAKALFAAMRSDGVDLTKQDAVRRWIDNFNRRPFPQRDAILPPLPGVS